MKIIVFSLFVCLPFAGYTQKSIKTHRHKQMAKSANATILPQWAAVKHYNATTHTYYTDYYSYYDPQRGGYVYLKDGQYSFTPAASPYLEKVDEDRSELKISRVLSLDLHPQFDYPYYMTLYPLVPGNSKVPVPLPDNPAQR